MKEIRTTDAAGHIRPPEKSHPSVDPAELQKHTFHPELWTDAPERCFVHLVGTGKPPEGSTAVTFHFSPFFFSHLQPEPDNCLLQRI